MINFKDDTKKSSENMNDEGLIDMFENDACFLDEFDEFGEKNETHVASDFKKSEKCAKKRKLSFPNSGKQESLPITRVVTIHPGQTVVTFMSETLALSLGNRFQGKMLPPPRPKLPKSDSPLYTKEHKSYFDILYNKYSTNIMETLKKAMENGKTEQYMNFEFNDFRAKYELCLGRPCVVLDHFLRALQVEEGEGPFPQYGGQMYGLTFVLLHNAKFSVRFSW